MFTEFMGIFSSLLQFHSTTMKSGNNTTASVFNSSIQGLKQSDTVLHQNSFKASPELVKAVAEKTDNPRDMIIVLTAIAKLENS